MNISVTEGSPEGKSFAEYINFLNDNHYIPPKGKTWVESLRNIGNEANHKIISRTKDDAILMLRFTEMLLKFIYEAPGLLDNTEGE